MTSRDLSDDVLCEFDGRRLTGYRDKIEMPPDPNGFRNFIPGPANYFIDGEPVSEQEAHAFLAQFAAASGVTPTGSTTVAPASVVDAARDWTRQVQG